MSAPKFRRHIGRPQHGAATLVVVMVLFFIVSLVAAYTNRNLIFEQRTSANQYRSTQALEAAEAGVEWALAMLNHGRITDLCLNTSDPPPALPADPSYRQRYVDTDPATGRLTPVLKADGTPRSQACVFNGSTWNCSCPNGDADPAPVAPVSADMLPAFRVRLEQIGAFPPTAAPDRAGVIRIHAVGCTRLDVAGCLAFDSPGVSQEGRSAVRVLVALTGNAVSPPSAAVLARGAINLTGAGVVANTEPTGSGITLHSGATISSTAVLYSSPGTPSAQSAVPSDPALNLAAVAPFTAEDRMFASVFNMTSSTFEQQPAAVILECAGGSCDAAEVRDAVLVNPGRPLWLRGNLAVDSAGDIGSAAAPVLLVVNGNVSFPTPGVTIHGMVYTRTADWAVTGSGRINGAAVAQGSLSGSGSPTVVRDSDVLFRLRYGSGSFVRVPGSWKDFQ